MENGVPVFLYGGTSDILSSLIKNLGKRFPELKIAGAEPSKFRRLRPGEKEALAARIIESGAAVTLVGLGCPRQEIFAFEFRHSLSMPIVAVGAAFPFLAGLVPQAPLWMQRRGLEWLFRLSCEPGRLWRRYLFLNPAYIVLLTMQVSGLRQFSTRGIAPLQEQLFG
jgi:exopolysaccharide biosynthesis WecB/TagA/CpsF family protein